MKKQGLFAIVLMVLIAMVMYSPVSAQSGGPQTEPPSPEMVEEINATRGAALLEYYPGYAVISVPVTGSSFYFHPHAPPTAAQLEAFARTRGAALSGYWEQ